MRIGRLGAPLLVVAVALLSGCGGRAAGVHAVAPGTQDQLVGIAPDAGEYTLYRAMGFAENHDPHVEPLWTVQLAQGQKMGFKWEAGEDVYDGKGAHLIAFAGDNARDMGTLVNRDTKYVWAGAHGDVAGYFHGNEVNSTVRTLTMQ